MSFLVEANKTIYTNLKIGQTGTYYFILSGISELEQITMSLTVQTTNVTVSPVQTKRPVISSSYGHKIIQFNLGPGDHAVTLSVPSNLGNFTVSYVWLDLAHPVNTRFTGPMTNLIRVYALEWEATNGTYFSFDHPAGSPLVLRAEVYNSSWDLVSTFIVGGSLMVSTTGSYYILVWATKHEGEFTIQLTEDSPTTSDDPYYTYTEENTRTNDGASAGMSIFQFISAMILLSILTTNFRKKKKK